MSNLSLTACSFYVKRANSRGFDEIQSLNKEIAIHLADCNSTISNISTVFTSFFTSYNCLYKDDDKKQSLKCNFSSTNIIEEEKFTIYYTEIESGYYGLSSSIIDGETEDEVFQKGANDIDIRPFHLLVVIPKDSPTVNVQKGMLIFQNAGPYGIKTITTLLMKKYIKNQYNLTLECRSISPELFVKKILNKNSIYKIRMIKNIKSLDDADNLSTGYGTEMREIGELNFNKSKWTALMKKFKHFASGRNTIFEFEKIEYNDLKVIAKVGDRTRTISLHNLDRLSIIEAIPENIEGIDGHPIKDKLLEYLTNVTSEYLNEMVLQITT